MAFLTLLLEKDPKVRPETNDFRGREGGAKEQAHKIIKLTLGIS